jgi:hypothetical protein
VPLALVAVAGLVLVACSDDDAAGGEGSTPTDVPSSTTSSTAGTDTTTGSDSTAGTDTTTGSDSTAGTDTTGGAVTAEVPADVATALEEAGLDCTDFESEDFGDPTVGGIGFGECTVGDLPVEIYVSASFPRLEGFVSTELRTACAFENTRRLSEQQEPLTLYKLVVGNGFVITSKSGTEWTATVIEPATGDAEIGRIATALGGQGASVLCPEPDQ